MVKPALIIVWTFFVLVFTAGFANLLILNGTYARKRSADAHCNCETYNNISGWSKIGPTAPNIRDTFFLELEQDLPIGQSENELKILKLLHTTHPRHELTARFPLKSIPFVIETRSGLCMLGSHLTKGTICENSVRGNSSWTPDPHVRDIISTVLFTCGLRSVSDDCFAIDVGSNVGAHTMVMLLLGARVVAIEPQTDFCVASRLSAAAAGYANRSHIVCGGLAPSRSTPRTDKLGLDTNNWRYEGKISDMPYRLEPVALVSLERLVSHHLKVDMLKIDTDSIDCLVLQQAMDMMESRGVQIKAMLLESWDNSCTNKNLIGHQILKLSRLGYNIYRTLVYERSWDEHHRDYENDFRPVKLPKGWTEEFHVGFNFVLWKANTDSMSDDELVAHPIAYPRWQYFFINGVEILQAGYRTKDL